MLKLRKLNFSVHNSICFNNIIKILKNKKIKGKIIGGYYPYNYELDALNILQKFEVKNYLISLPRIEKNFKMHFYQWSIKDPLSINKYGIPEPISNKLLYPDILFVPLLAFDKYLNRVGYGGGFYDRYINKIKKEKKVTTIGIAYSFQKVKKIITNNHDIKLDFIISEKNIHQ